MVFVACEASQIWKLPETRDPTWEFERRRIGAAYVPTDHIYGSIRYCNYVVGDYVVGGDEGI